MNISIAQVTGFGLSEFSRTDEIAAIGEASAKLAIAKIEELLRQLDATLFSVNSPHLSFVQCDMCDTGIESGSVDIVTGSYALRNAPDLEKAFAETRRILKPGGVAAFLDFSKPSQQSLQVAEYWLLKLMGK